MVRTPTPGGPPRAGCPMQSYDLSYDEGRYAVASAAASERAAFIRRTYGHVAGAILAFVGIEAALFASGQLLLEPGEFGGQRIDLLIQFLTRIQAVLAGIGIDAKVGHRRRRYRVESDPGQPSFQSCARNHVAKMKRPG